MSPLLMNAIARVALIAVAASAIQISPGQITWAAETDDPTETGEDLRREGEMLFEEQIDVGEWEIPTDFTEARSVAAEGRMTRKDTEELLEGIRKAAGPNGGTILVTVTDGGMVDLAQNMLHSLDAVPSKARRLVVAMGFDICSEFDGLPHTTCVEVFRDMPSEGEVSWGSHEYWEVVFNKHVILTVIATSGISRGVIYTDPDIAYLDSPVGYLVKLAESYDITFSPNNMLALGAQSVEDLAPEYEKRGLANTTLGPYNRHVDINTGLFHMRSSEVVTKLMLTTMRIFKEQEFVHGHYQQYSLVQALAQVEGIRVGVAAGDVLVNGNVFWGHRDALARSHPISVHANWMQPELKRPCLQYAGLWIDLSGARLAGRLTFRGAHDTAEMDSRGATVAACRPR